MGMRLSTQGPTGDDGHLGAAGRDGAVDDAADHREDPGTVPVAIKDSDLGWQHSTIVDLNDLTVNPSAYDFFTFRPNVEKLILAGAAETEHISILWYPLADGSVGQHAHAMTEAVYTIKGCQSDAKGVYPTGSLYFNPPGSGHRIANSTGFFILAYAAPPDFGNTDRIQDYTPVQINTADPDLAGRYPFEAVQDGVSVYRIPLDPAGGMSSELIQTTASLGYRYTGNYLLVLQGRCTINGQPVGQNQLVVATTVAPQAYRVSTEAGAACLVLGLSF